MSDTRIQAFKTAIAALDNKTAKLFLFAPDTKGQPTASVNTIYTWGKHLQNMGYSPVILHERKDYVKPDAWMGSDYPELPHACAEEKNVQLSLNDFLFIPELYANVMESTKNIPSHRVVITQAYDSILDLLQPGKSWTDFGIGESVTICESQKKYINYLMPSIRTDVVNISIPTYFAPSDKPQKPVVSIHTRDQRDTLRIVKTFFLKYPQYRWVTFRELRGLPREQFAEAIKESCLVVWDDPNAGFGTFPLEAFRCGTPLLGVQPFLKPDWMSQDGREAIWAKHTKDLPDGIGNFFRVWLEDLIPQELYDNMKPFQEGGELDYTVEKEKKSLEAYMTNLFARRREQLSQALAQLEAQQPKNEIINLFD